jgi:hypothetical protein
MFLVGLESMRLKFNSGFVHLKLETKNALLIIVQFIDPGITEI